MAAFTTLANRSRAGVHDLEQQFKAGMEFVFPPTFRLDFLSASLVSSRSTILPTQQPTPAPATTAPVVAHPGEEGAPALVQTRLPQEGAAAEAPVREPQRA